MIDLRRAFSFIIPLVLAAACGGAAQDSAPGDGDGDGDTAPVDLEEALEGRTFVLESAEGYALVPNTTASVSFEPGLLSFMVGCNGHSAEVTFDGEVLVAEDFSSTDIGCADELHDQDAWFAAFFSDRPTVSLAGNVVTFTTETATLVFIDEDAGAEPVPLIGTVWEIRELTDRNSASGGFDVQPTVTFTPDGTVEVFTGCNVGRGGYEVAGDSITFPDGIGYTEEGCTDSGLSSVEEHMQAVFTDGEVTYSLSDDELVIERGDLGVRAREMR